MARPNILLIFTDQQRHDTLRAGGNSVIVTPHLDRLVNEGVCFGSAYTPSPVCVPARCSLVYGQYPHLTGCADNGDPMPADRSSLMQRLTEVGYRTHGIGKMHFQPHAQALRGFQSREHSEEIRASIGDDDYLQFLRANGYDHVYDPMGPRGEMYYIPQPAQMPARLHHTQWVGDRALAFVEDADLGTPFFLFASFIHPHPPFSPPTPWNKLYRGPLMPLPKVPEQAEAFHTYINKVQNRYKYRDNGSDRNLLRTLKAHYYGCVSFIDYQVGRMLSALEARGLLENTLILFTSDHGEFLGDYGCFGKRSMLDAAARVPLIVRYPQRFAPGTRCETPTSLVDVMPTLLGAADVGTDQLNLSGMDLAAIAADTDGRYVDRRVYSQFQWRAQGVHMVVDRRLKYLYSAPDRREYLLDRVQDPQELRNRAGLPFCQDALTQMREGLFTHYRSQGHNEPLDGDTWRLYPQPSLSEDPDDGLLIQDPPWSQPYQEIPGYTGG